MSAIIIDLRPDKALIATDTLAVDLQGAPSGFTSKAFVLPHINLVIAGTGIAGISSAWFRYVNEVLSPLGIEGLNATTQQHLKGMFEAEFARRWPGINLHSTTVYHVGVSELDGSIKGYRYSLSEGFEPKPLPYRVLCKPSAGKFPDGLDDYSTLVELMCRQKALEESKPFGDRQHIGGGIQLIELSSTGAMSARIYQVDDFEEAALAIAAKSSL